MNQPLDGTTLSPAAVLRELQSAAEAVLGPDAPAIDEDYPLVGDAVDSLDLIEIVMILEERHDIKVEMHELEDCKTFGDAARVFLGRLAKE